MEFDEKSSSTNGNFLILSKRTSLALADFSFYLSFSLSLPNHPSQLIYYKTDPTFSGFTQTWREQQKKIEKNTINRMRPNSFFLEFLLCSQSS